MIVNFFLEITEEKKNREEFILVIIFDFFFIKKVKIIIFLGVNVVVWKNFF